MSEKTLAFLDIETSGLNPHKHEVIEVAYVFDHANGSYLEEHFSLYFSYGHADKKALEINRWEQRRDELAEIEIPYHIAVDKLLVDLADCVIVGANPAFDTAFLREFLWLRDCVEPTWYYRSIDINTLAAGVAREPLPLSTADVAEKFSVPLSNDQHTALADARWNRSAYHAIVNHD